MTAKRQRPVHCGKTGRPKPDPSARRQSRARALHRQNSLLRRRLRDLLREKREDEIVRASEARLRQVIDASPIPLSVDDMKGAIEYVNRKFIEKFGYSHREIPTSSVWFSKAYPDPDYRRQVAARWNASLQKGLKYGRVIGPMEVEVTCKDGSVRHIEFVGTRLGSQMLIAAHDHTERERLEQQILDISERERERIGQDLHDGLCQLLSGIKFKTTLLEQKLQGKGLDQSQDAAEIERLLNTAIHQARNVARGLHPVEIEAHGLMAALQTLAETVSNVFGVVCVCELSKPVLVHDHIIATHLYRIAQEALTNAIKHGRASRIRVKLVGQRDGLALTVQDDGVGFPARASRKTGLGLHLMHYRARAMGAHLEISRLEQQGGTLVRCWIRRAYRKLMDRRKL